MATKLYVGNLSFRTTSEELRDAFASVGTVESASVIEDRDREDRIVGAIGRAEPNRKRIVVVVHELVRRRHASTKPRQNGSRQSRHGRVETSHEGDELRARLGLHREIKN